MYLLHGIIKPTKKGNDVKPKGSASIKINNDPINKGPASNIKKGAGKNFKKGKHDKCGIMDSIEFMMKTKTNISATAPKKKLEQPYILCIGDDIYHLNQFYVVMEETTYSATSFLHAVEIAFKIYNLFGFSYPYQSYNVWLFIQKYFFDLHFSEYDDISTDAESLMTKLDCFEKELASFA